WSHCRYQPPLPATVLPPPDQRPATQRPPSHCVVRSHCPLPAAAPVLGCHLPTAQLPTSRLPRCPAPLPPGVAAPPRTRSMVSQPTPHSLPRRPVPWPDWVIWH